MPTMRDENDTSALFLLVIGIAVAVTCLGIGLALFGVALLFGHG